MQAAGLDGIELEAYGHLIDQFWSPLTNDLDAPYGGSLDNRMRFTFDVLRAIRARVRRRTSSSACATPATRACRAALTEADGLEISRRLRDSGLVDFLNVIRGHIDTDAGLDRRDPDPGHAERAASRLRRRGPRRDRLPDLPRRADPGRRDRAARDRQRQARHGRHDPRAHGRPAYRARRSSRAARTTSAPASARTTASTASTRAARRSASTTPPPGASSSMPHAIAPAAERATDRHRRRRSRRARGGARRRRARPRGDGLRGGGRARRADPADARRSARREMIAIVRLAHGSSASGAASRSASTATPTADDVLATEPDVVIVATGGLPHTEVLASGNDLVVSAWDILSGDVRPGAERADLRRRRRPCRAAGGRADRRRPAPGSRSSRRTASSRPR